MKDKANRALSEELFEPRASNPGYEKKHNEKMLQHNTNEVRQLKSEPIVQQYTNNTYNAALFA